MNLLKYFSIALIILLSGCATSGHQQFYNQQAPLKYPQTQDVYVFEYSNLNLTDIQKILFNEYLVIGKSGFEGPYEDPLSAEDYAKSIGADILITNTQFKEKRTSMIPMSTPTTSTTYVNSGLNSFTMTSYGTQTTMMPITVHRYDQDGIFLKNINNIVPVWEKKKKDYIKTNKNELEGLWENESYVFNVYQSNNQIVACIVESKKNYEAWKEDDLKLIFGVSSNKGIYLMSDKTPIPSTFKVNKFGHLEVTLLTSSEVFSFQRKL